MRTTHWVDDCDIARMKNEGCDAVILGCTEIPLISALHGAVTPALTGIKRMAPCRWKPGSC